MPRPKGLPKTGGRKKGSQAKRVSIGHSMLPAGISDKLRALGCDPIDGMVTIANEARLAKDFALAGRMYAELAQYQHPKLKAVEHSGEIASSAITVVISPADAKML